MLTAHGYIDRAAVSAQDLWQQLLSQQENATGRMKTTKEAPHGVKSPVVGLSLLSGNVVTFGSRLVTQVCLKTQSSVLITWQLFYTICKILITVSIMLSCSVSWHSKCVYKDMISGWTPHIWLHHVIKGEGNERHVLSFRNARLKATFPVNCEPV